MLIHHALPEFAWEGKRLAELFHKVWNILQKASADSDTIICILDGLNECEEQDRNRLLRAIAQLYSGRKSSPSESHQPKLKFLLTSRSYSQGFGIQKQVEVLGNALPNMHIEGKTERNAISRNINIVIRDRISTLSLELFREVNESEKLLLQRELLSVTHETHRLSKKIFNTIRGIEDPEDPEIIHWAITNGHSGLLRILLETGNTLQMDLNCTGSDRTPLSHAAEKGHTEVVEQLLETGRVKLDSTDNAGRTPLFYASLHLRDDIVRLLLKAEAKINHVDENGRTPMSHVAEMGKATMVQTLLDAKADIEVRDKSGKTAIFHAVQNNQDVVVDMLLKGNSIIDSKDHRGHTPLFWAAKEGNDRVLTQLLATGMAEVNLKDIMGRTALSYAAQNGHNKVVAKLVGASQAEVNSTSARRLGRRTALSFAAENGHFAVVKELLAVDNIDINLMSDFWEDVPSHKTALDYARENGHTDVAQLILDYRTKKSVLRRIMRGRLGRD